MTNKSKKHNKKITIKKPFNTKLSTFTNKNLLINNDVSVSKDINHDINNYITSEVIDDTTYNHFKSLIKKSNNLCKGTTQTGSKYINKKINIKKYG